MKKEVEITYTTQDEINKWERQNFHRYTGWEKDYEKNTITFFFSDKTEKCFSTNPPPR